MYLLLARVRGWGPGIVAKLTLYQTERYVEDALEEMQAMAGATPVTPGCKRHATLEDAQAASAVIGQ